VSASVDEVLGEAAKLEKEYEWLQASRARVRVGGVDLS